jgi:hypothetical protein
MIAVYRITKFAMQSARDFDSIRAGCALHEIFVRSTAHDNFPS